MSIGDTHRRSVWFLTGTRADFGKLKPLILAAAEVNDVDVTVVATGMHLIDRYGSTVNEVRRLAPTVKVEEFSNQSEGDTMDRVMAATITGLSGLFDTSEPDLLVVHGDRVEALAGAATGAMRNIVVAHVEGGELSGTIDGVLRHAISKLSHLHLVANDEAARRVVQLGEHPSTVWVIGSPDIDVMLSDSLPGIDEVRDAYEITFDRYAIVLMHGVTTEGGSANYEVGREMVAALLDSGMNAVVIHPNNDPGSDEILRSYRALVGDPRFRMLPSMRFESFLTLLRNATVLIGNSSAGIREAPIYGVPSVNIGSRQRGRAAHASVLDAGSRKASIERCLKTASTTERTPPALHFGTGDSAARFRNLIEQGDLWQLDVDKVFHDVSGDD